MIWIRNKDNNKIEGYVPQLNKEYSESDIFEMSKYNHVQGWSKLSEIVMGIEGIPETHIYSFDDRGMTVVKNLADLELEFDFEFLDSNEEMDKYIYQVYEVFNNLELLKVEEYTEEELENKMNYLRHFFSYKMQFEVGYECNLIKRKADKNLMDLTKVLDRLKGEGLEVNNMFGSSLLYDGIYKEREAKKELVIDCRF